MIASRRRTTRRRHATRFDLKLFDRWSIDLRSYMAAVSPRVTARSGEWSHVDYGCMASVEQDLSHAARRRARMRRTAVRKSMKASWDVRESLSNSSLGTGHGEGLVTSTSSGGTAFILEEKLDIVGGIFRHVDLSGTC